MNSSHLLERIATSWYKRARINNHIDLDVAFDLEKEDFLVDQLPFKDNPLFQTSEIWHTKALSCGWIAYNAKTIAIETDIVHPVCLSLLNGEFGKTLDFTTKRLITETIVDESYHMHLCYFSNDIVQKNRNISLCIPSFSFVNRMRAYQHEHNEPWQKSIIALATAIASEIYITDYLSLVSHAVNDKIQPLNQLIVKTHRSDELVHGSIFKHIAHLIYHSLSAKQKLFFAKNIFKPISWLSDLEFDVWESMLLQIGFPNATQLITQTRMNEVTYQKDVIQENEGLDEFYTLAKELGIEQIAIENMLN